MVGLLGMTVLHHVEEGHNSGIGLLNRQLRTVDRYVMENPQSPRLAGQLRAPLVWVVDSESN